MTDCSKLTFNPDHNGECLNCDETQEFCQCQLITAIVNENTLNNKYMTKEQEVIYKQISDKYNSEKGKGFITHLLRSFFPADKTYFVMMQEKEEPMLCCITKQPLICKMEVLGMHMETDKDEFIQYMKAQVNASLTEREQKELPEHPLKKKLDGKVLAIGCKDSDKFLCKDAWEQLYNFMATELLSGNQHIGYIMKNERNKTIVSHLKDKNIIENPTEEKVVQKQLEKPKKMTLGDLGVLQGIKEKLEKEELNKKNN